MTHPIVPAITAIASASVAHTPCQIRHVQWTPPTQPCRRCGAPAPRVWDAGRTAIDLDLDAPVLLQVTVSVHRCPECHHAFRAQPPFLRPDAIYLNRVVAKAVQAVALDGLAFRRVPERLARDFGVCPSEASVRVWWRLYRTHLEDQESYLPWVVEEFSGILCVDEVYQGHLALLLAVDPAAPTGDRLVGYQLVEGAVDHEATSAFLTRLKDAGICPEEVITDGSTRYPALLAAIWPTAAHQLCLFHETRHITEAAGAVLTLARRAIPTPPPRPRRGRGGPVSAEPPTPHRDDPATQQWHLRRAQRHSDLALVHALARQGFSHHAIARQTGRQRRTIRAWLAQEIPHLSAETQEIAARAAAGSDGPLRRRRHTPARHARVQALAQQGLSHAAIARITGLHRVTVSHWLKMDLVTRSTGAPVPQARGAGGTQEVVAQDSPSAEQSVAKDRVAEMASPPAPWTSWEQVWHVRETLKAHRWLCLRRPEHLSADQQERIDTLVAGPLGDLVGTARGFLLEWYALWRTEDGHRRPLTEAQERYLCWRTNPAYRTLPPLRKVQDLMSPTRFTRLSQFLRQPHWEATNNGAERAGRAFRHAQAPHFRLRANEAIEGALRIVTGHAKQKAISAPLRLPRLCLRGRSPRSAEAATQIA